MAVLIKVPDSAWHTQKIPLEGTPYLVTFKFNTRDQSWYLDFNTLLDEPILTGVKVMPNQNLTGRYSYLSDLQGGNLWCLRFKNDQNVIDRGNLGVDKTYQLVWLTTSEEEELDINGKIQL